MDVGKRMTGIGRSEIVKLFIFQVSSGKRGAVGERMRVIHQHYGSDFFNGESIYGILDKNIGTVPGENNIVLVV